MKRIVLSEYKRSAPINLLREDIVALQRLVPQMRIEPSSAGKDLYELTPDSHVGVIRVGDTIVEIRPKLSIDRFFFILSYAVDPSAWRSEIVDFEAKDSIIEAVAPAFCRLISQATYRGLLHGYLTVEEALPVIRGQIRFHEQLQRRYGLALPVEVRYDEFSQDIDENRILLAALHSLGRLPLRSVAVQRGLREVLAAFEAVTLLRYTPRTVPSIHFTRLNKHYEPAIRLATLILKWTSIELGKGSGIGTCFLINMNDIFEMFVHKALCESLGVSDSEFPRKDSRLALDDAHQIGLEPDLSWWQKGKCRFVGDVKYKRVNVAGIKHPDLYQLLAYVTSANLPTGMLIYAAGEGNPKRHRVKNAAKTLIVEQLDISGPPSEILDQIECLATEVRAMSGIS